MVDKAGSATAIQGPWATVTQQQVLESAIATFQHMGGLTGDAMDRTGIDRDGIAATSNGHIRVPHDGRAKPHQLQNVQDLMQGELDEMFEGSGIKVLVDGPQS